MPKLLKSLIGLSVLLIAVVSPGLSMAAVKNRDTCALALSARDLSWKLQPGVLLQKKKNVYLVLRAERASKTGDGFRDDLRIEVLPLRDVNSERHTFERSEAHFISEKSFFEGMGYLSENAMNYTLAKLQKLTAPHLSRYLELGEIFRHDKRTFVALRTEENVLHALEMQRGGGVGSEPVEIKFDREVTAVEVVGRAAIQIALIRY